MHNELINKYTIILCGGRGNRLGSIAESIPKALLKLHDKPILWYTFFMLYKQGIRNFIFPLGYKGDMIKKYVSNEFNEFECNFNFIETGEDTPINLRLQKVVQLIPEHEDFFLINGDTFFDFNIQNMYRLHRRNNSLITLSSVEITPSYGIIIMKDGDLLGFSHKRKISHFSLDDNNTLQGYINAGLVWINKDSLKLAEFGKEIDLEQQLYHKVIEMGKASHYRIEGKWFAIDTQKDLNLINSRSVRTNRTLEFL
jgi:NDP-sugar pyrophosphorylase family protein